MSGYNIKAIDAELECLNERIAERNATIASQAAEIDRLDEALRGVLSWAEYIAGDGSNLTAHEVWEELHTIELARAALQPKEGEG
jgi:hypothetical protein